ncbi:MAG TPA: T9SS type A sorting domain-containing protein, partial [Agriterribacter sp.]|nr:T9SS type A sorting domain-containing protein [Agriterribacter sp.]
PPLITYKPGGYDVRLIVENELCRLRDTAILELVVNGLDRYTPESGGPGNILFTVYGGGFREGMTVQLKQGGVVKTSVDTASWVNERGSVFTAVIDMHDAPLGVYDVVISTHDTTYSIPEGYVTEALVRKLTGEIAGRDIIRFNTDNVYTIRVHNEGNTMAGHTEVYFLTPMDMEVTRLDSLLLGSYNDIALDTIREYSLVTKDRGYPYDGKLWGYYIAGIPAGEYQDIRFNVNATTIGKEKMHLWVKGPYSGSEYSSIFDDCIKSILKTAGDLAMDGISAVPGLDCIANGIRLGVTSLYTAGSYLWNKFTGGSSSGEKTSSSLSKALASAAKNCAGEAALISVVGAEAAPFVELVDFYTDAVILGLNLGDNIINIKEKCKDDPEDEKEKEIDSRASLDPNTKSGPSGFGEARFINGKDKRMSYTILFENMNTATLPAQQVIILDTLDKNVYDLSTFSPKQFGFGSQSYHIPAGAKEYVEDISYTQNLSVRFYIHLDEETGIIKATFKTIDKATGTITADPLAGFLPPNVTAPEGEGYISFSVNMKDNLPHGTVIANRASIIFDTNEPIITDVWSNTIDRNLPSSGVTEARKVTDSTIVVKVNGNDAGSGIRIYHLYYSENDEPYRYGGKIKDSSLVKVNSVSTYSFYSISEDKVGNVESKTGAAEASVNMKPEGQVNNEGRFYLYPVPSRGTIHMELDVPEAQQLIIAVYSASGQRVAELYNGNANSGDLKITQSLHNLGSGLYFVHARGSKGLNLKKKMVLVK